ncbi:hypothetical protein CEXT_429171 [Caerostris extrusa]|uniref:Uncharacterized protein n=1 Tax=Caerostris extrusa TaxID=172846 RepID=A0AAV4MY97_CAEEX|nr:hypothetical protein CEXT_429171 [Caerostris extrusa]
MFTITVINNRRYTLTTNKYLDTYANDDICGPENSNHIPDAKANKKPCHRVKNSKQLHTKTNKTSYLKHPNALMIGGIYHSTTVVGIRVELKTSSRLLFKLLPIKRSVVSRPYRVNRLRALHSDGDATRT